MNRRSRAFCFTWNNYDDNSITTLGGISCRYLIYGKEVAPETGTPHLQGYIYFNNARSFSSVRTELLGSHLTIARGTSLDNYKYCSKGGEFTERGERPLSPEEKGNKEVQRWVDTWDAAITGRIEDIPHDIRIRNYSAIKRIQRDYMPQAQELTGVCGIWIHGEAGAGKTRAAVKAHPGAFIKPRNTWWDGYQHEPTVICDDVDRFDVRLGGHFKHWADYLPFVGEVKGGSMRIRPNKFIVTSQYTIEEIWEDAATRAALTRRFTIIHKTKDQDIIL